MVMNHVLLALAWVIYCIVHSVFASRPFKKKMQGWMGKAYRHFRLFYNLFALFALAAMVYFQFSISSPKLFQTAKSIMITGTIVAIAGFSIMIVCIKNYFISLSGLKSSFSEIPENRLITTGIHRYVRHPLYLGTFILLWGLFLLQPYFSLLLVNLIIMIYTIIATRLEEDKLFGAFGESYRQYQQDVPKFLPPFLTKR